MDKANDRVFGEMIYDNGWKKEAALSLFGRSGKVNIMAAAYTGEQITDAQRQSYLRYQELTDEYISKIPDKLLEYYLRNYDFIKDSIDIPDKYDREHITKDLIVKLIKVRTVYFAYDGPFAWLCDCAWAPDDGIAILLSESEPKIIEQDEII